MGNYVTSAQIAAKMPYRTFTATSEPSTSNIDDWIGEAEAVLNGQLSAAQIGAPVTSAEGIKILRAWVSDAVIGTIRQAFAQAGGDPNNEAGLAQIERFNDRLIDIANNPARYYSMLVGGSTATSNRQFKSHVTDHPDGKSVAAGDFEPVFSRGMKF